MAINPDQPFTPEHAEYCFRRAVCSMAGAKERWAARAERPMSDAELAEALRYEIGEFGGGGGPDTVDYAYQKSGLKIWGGWKWPNPHTTKPLFQGTATIAETRRLFGICKPSDDRQLSLFGGM
ncbi:hypothetical protein ACCS68_14680 [Rhizobium beringeri]|uniref:hypothetical protein n=1 Tax=Rhizobium TaxID=379 RepID=UPI00103207DC|nr:hypothetical protein [Rhizobium leguminosarum]TBH23608.1 hypothetical protein ELG64_08880 [Rhizobium leguminosarum]